ncbi:lysis protein [Xenorhabdus kozodoii]|uniref:Peptidase n=1 Tax=Xenorhabdus kozodoii TaxID=351676 RepID=A0A2D0LHC2_9GAMM|nr:peptidase [Xenorhabdus kozodoii]
MSWKLNAFIVIAGFLLAALWTVANGYQELGRKYKELVDDFAKQNVIITTQQARIQQLHELDTQHTQELANAKTEIDTLRADVAAGRRKLRIQASCPVFETVASGSVDDGTTVELSGETGSTVLDIREGIINDRAKLRYLQDYVNTECRGTEK